MLKEFGVVMLRSVGSAFLLINLGNWGCGGQSNNQAAAKDCPAGTLGCTCYGNDTCNRGLDCSLQICVESAGGDWGEGGSRARPDASAVGGAHDVSATAPQGTGHSALLLPAAGGSPASGGASSTGGAVVRTNGSVATGGVGISVGPVVPSSGGRTGCGTSQGRGLISVEVDVGPYCGDGVIDNAMGENCDDCNRTGGDGCSGVCQTEPNWECPAVGQPCRSLVVCGDGRRGIGEGCDDGNQKPNDGCSTTCQTEAGWRCDVDNKPCVHLTTGCTEGCASPANCGNGVIEPPETCDDGSNTGAYGACMPDCQRAAYCGDGVRSGDEACDYGAENVLPAHAEYGSCLVSCEFGPSCGDGTVQTPFEQCDEGKETTTCDANCMLPRGR